MFTVREGSSNEAKLYPHKLKMTASEIDRAIGVRDPINRQQLIGLRFAGTALSSLYGHAA